MNRFPSLRCASAIQIVRPLSAMDSQDVAGVAQRAATSLDAIKESRANIAEIERKLVAILDAKPFGLPLTAQEKRFSKR
jgi:hypothetical protein